MARHVSWTERMWRAALPLLCWYALTQFAEAQGVSTFAGNAQHTAIYQPAAVREWCINTAAVNPATNSIFAPSEDGHIYRWNLATNSLSQAVALSPGIGERCAKRNEKRRR